MKCNKMQIGLLVLLCFKGVFACEGGKDIASGKRKLDTITAKEAEKAAKAAKAEIAAAKEAKAAEKAAEKEATARRIVTAVRSMKNRERFFLCRKYRESQLPDAQHDLDIYVERFKNALSLSVVYQQYLRAVDFLEIPKSDLEKRKIELMRKEDCEKQRKSHNLKQEKKEKEEIEAVSILMHLKDN